MYLKHDETLSSHNHGGRACPEEVAFRLSENDAFNALNSLQESKRDDILADIDLNEI
jgi:hypothetical protein